MPIIPPLNPIDAQPETWESDPTIKAPPVGQRATWEPNRPLPPDPSRIGTTLRDPVSGDPFEREIGGMGEGQPKPVSHVLAERIKTQGAYRDIPSFMADVRMEAYKLAPQLGVDLRTPEGQAWIKDTITEAEKSFPHYVSPPTDKKQMIVAKPGEYIFDGKKWISPDDQMGQAQGIVAPNYSNQPESPTKDPRDALVERAKAEMANLVASGRTNHPRIPDLQKILDQADDRAHKLKEEGRKDAKDQREQDDLLKPTGEIQKSYSSAVNTMKGIENLRSKMKEMKDLGIVPSANEKALMVMINNKPEGYLAARGQMIARGLVDPTRMKHFEELEAIKGAVRSDVTTARAGLSQSVAELANVVPFTPQITDFEELETKLPQLEKLMKTAITSSNKLYPALEKSGISGGKPGFGNMSNVDYGGDGLGQVLSGAIPPPKGMKLQKNKKTGEVRLVKE